MFRVPRSGKRLRPAPLQSAPRPLDAPLEDSSSESSDADENDTDELTVQEIRARTEAAKIGIATTREVARKRRMLKRELPAIRVVIRHAADQGLNRASFKFANRDAPELADIQRRLPGFTITSRTTLPGHGVDFLFSW